MSSNNPFKKVKESVKEKFKKLKAHGSRTASPVPSASGAEATTVGQPAAGHQASSIAVSLDLEPSGAAIGFAGQGNKGIGQPDQGRASNVGTAHPTDAASPPLVLISDTENEGIQSPQSIGGVLVPVSGHQGSDASKETIGSTVPDSTPSCFLVPLAAQSIACFVF